MRRIDGRKIGELMPSLCHSSQKQKNRDYRRDRIRRKASPNTTCLHEVERHSVWLLHSSHDKSKRVKRTEYQLTSKSRRHSAASIKLLIPFYRQVSQFTCGPACLMMAMKFFQPSLNLNRKLEFDIWREANLVESYGTSKEGLALAAARRGFDVYTLGRALRHIERKELFCIGIQYISVSMKKNLDEWETLARAGQVDLAKLTRDQVEYCHGFCWTCVKRWCPWNETPPLRTGRVTWSRSLRVQSTRLSSRILELGYGDVTSRRKDL